MGGAERLLLDLHPHLSDVEFVVVALRGGELLETYRAAGIRTIILERSPLDPRWVVALRRLIAEEEPDLIHPQLPVTAIAARLVGRVAGVPVVYTEQTSPAIYHPLTRVANAATYSLNRRVVAVSSAVERAISRSSATGRRSDRVVVIRTGIDPDRVEREAAVEPSPVIPRDAYGSVTHLTSVKGPDVLVEAAAIVAKSLPERRCVIVGEGPLRAQLAARVRELDAPVDLLGRRSDARSIMARLDVAVFPSRMEGLPLAVLEAMALRKPIVATRVGGIPEAIEHERTGLLVDPDDPAALATAILTLLDDVSLAKTLGEAARAELETRFDVKKWAKAMRRVYEEALRP